MEEIKSYILRICVLCVVSCICSYLLSDHSVSKPIIGIINLIILISVVRPLLSEDVLLRGMHDVLQYNEVAYETVNEEYMHDILCAEIKKQIYADVSLIIEKYCKCEYEVLIETDIQSDNSIDIEQITVVLQSAAVSELLESELKNYNDICVVLTEEKIENAEYADIASNAGYDPEK